MVGDGNSASESGSLQSQSTSIVRLTVACGDDLRFFDVKLPVVTAEQYKRAVTLASKSFARTVRATIGEGDKGEGKRKSKSAKRY
jgi:hypothetical protein